MAGIYIHIPFCKQACTYCNFHFSTSLAKKNDFLSSLKKEISLNSDFISQEECIDTIYFGGGTPSLLLPSEIDSILNAIQKKWLISSNAEITLEANPDNIDKKTLQSWHANGINRLSVGIQSFEEEELRWMNRAHSANQAVRCIHDIRESAIQNYSVDLIFGSPLLEDSQLKNNIKFIIEQDIPHISCYALTVEPKTALAASISAQKKPNIDSEKQASQFLLISDWLCEAGYDHYEISNYAKPGKTSKHNSSYWEGKAYHGFGPSAHSFDGKNKRRWNIANNSLYINNIINNTQIFEEEELSTTAQINEHIMIGLRKKEGINLNVMEIKFGATIKEKLLHKLKKYIDTEKIIISNQEVQLTREGKLFADGIAADLFF